MGPKMEDLLLLLGNPGRFQTLVICILAWAYAYVIAVNFSMLVVSVVPSHTCNLPSNWTWAKNQSVPLLEVGDPEVFDLCNVFIDPENQSLGVEPCPYGHQFQPDIDGRPEFASEWGLVCERQFMVRIVESTYIVGLILGGLLVGLVCDKYGRFTTFICSIIVEVLVILIIYFSTSYVSVVLLNFLRGIFLAYIQASAFVLSMEMTVDDTRVRTGVLTTAAGVLGTLWAAALAQGLTNWRNYILAISSAAIIPLLASWAIPESLRFLLAFQKVPKAAKVVERNSKFNREKVPDDITMHMKAISDDLKRQAGFTRGQNVLALVQKEKLRTSLIQIIPIIFAISLSRWIPTATLKSLGSGFFINVYVTSTVEIVATAVAYIPIIKLGRRISLFSSACIVAVTCLACAIFAAAMEAPGPMMIMSSISAMLMVVGFGGFAATVNLYVCELFPTTQRSTAFGLMIAFTHLGTIFTPELTTLGDAVWSHFPHILCGLLTALAAALAFFLPETKEQPLSDTIIHKYKNQGEIAANGDENDTSIPLKLVPKLSNAD